MAYDFKLDKEDEIFGRLFAENHLKKFKVAEGYFPDYDVLDIDTGLTYEVKRDKWYQHNEHILVEEFFNLETKNKGWIHHTKADFYVVFFTDTDYYIVSMAEVKEKFFNKDKYDVRWLCKDILQKEGFHTRNWVTDLHGNFSVRFFSTKKTKKIRPKKTEDWM